MNLENLKRRIPNLEIQNSSDLIRFAHDQLTADLRGITKLEERSKKEKSDVVQKYRRYLDPQIRQALEKAVAAITAIKQSIETCTDMLAPPQRRTPPNDPTS
jgi:hypothetical protein